MLRVSRRPACLFVSLISGLVAGRPGRVLAIGPKKQGAESFRAAVGRHIGRNGPQSQPEKGLKNLADSQLASLWRSFHLDQVRPLRIWDAPFDQSHCEHLRRGAGVVANSCMGCRAAHLSLDKFDHSRYGMRRSIKVIANICGEVPEWSNGAVSKTVVRASVPRVRIPVSPPFTV